MEDRKRLLEIRKKLKKKKPLFIKQDFHKKKRLKEKWRKPRGLHSKMRRSLKGYRKRISKGYKSPFLVRGLHHSGLKEVSISSVKDINKIKSKEEGIIIKRSVGLKKKIEIIKKAVEQSIKILNIKEPSKFLNETEEKLKKKKEEKDKKLSSKERKRKDKERKAEEKAKKKDEEKVKEEETEEDVKKEMKKEKDKLLIKKEI